MLRLATGPPGTSVPRRLAPRPLLRRRRSLVVARRLGADLRTRRAAALALAYPSLPSRSSSPAVATSAATPSRPKSTPPCASCATTWLACPATSSTLTTGARSYRGLGSTGSPHIHPRHTRPFCLFIGRQPLRRALSSTSSYGTCIARERFATTGGDSYEQYYWRCYGLLRYSFYRLLDLYESSVPVCLALHSLSLRIDLSLSLPLTLKSPQ